MGPGVTRDSVSGRVGLQTAGGVWPEEICDVGGAAGDG